jgi:hypothetical protein
MEIEQCFGCDDKNLYDPTKDLITHLQTSSCNKYLFTGDASGRVVVFSKKKVNNNQLWQPIYQYTGIEPHIDYLTNASTDNKITGFIPLQYNDNNMQTIVSDTKNIYIHKLLNKKKKFNSNRVPFRIKHKTKIETKHKFVNGHRFYIHSIALSKSFQHILSADDLSINIWDINRPEKALPIIDTTPNDLSTLNSTITKMKISNTHENIVYTSSSNGILSTFDTRIMCTVDTPVKIMYSSKMVSYDSVEHITSDIFTHKNSREHLKYISDFDISPQSDYIVARSPLFINIWDLRNTLNPCHSFPVHKKIYSFIKTNQEIAFEPFEVKYSNDNKYIYSGSFNNIICIDTQTLGISYMHDPQLREIGLDTPRVSRILPGGDNYNIFSAFNGVLNIHKSKI